MSRRYLAIVLSIVLVFGVLLVLLHYVTRGSDGLRMVVQGSWGEAPYVVLFTGDSHMAVASNRLWPDREALLSVDLNGRKRELMRFVGEIPRDEYVAPLVRGTAAKRSNLLALQFDSAHAIVMVVDTETGRVLSRIRGCYTLEEPWTQNRPFSPSGEYLLVYPKQGTTVGERRWAWIVESRTGRRVRDIPISVAASDNVRWTRSGRLCWLTDNGALLEESVGGVRRVLRLPDFSSDVCVHLSHDASLFATFNPDAKGRARVAMYRTADGRLVAARSFDVPPGCSIDVGEWSPDGRYLVLGMNHEFDGSQEIILMSTSGRVERISRMGWWLDLYTVSWSPDSRRFALLGTPEIGPTWWSDSVFVYELR